MQLRRSEIHFVLGADGPRKFASRPAQLERINGVAFFVALAARGSQVEAKKLPFRTMSEAMNHVGLGGTIGIPIARKGKLGIVFQAASVAKSSSEQQNKSS